MFGRLGHLIRTPAWFTSPARLAAATTIKPIRILFRPLSMSDRLEAVNSTWVRVAEAAAVGAAAVVVVPEVRAARQQLHPLESTLAQSRLVLDAEQHLRPRPQRQVTEDSAGINLRFQRSVQRG